MTGASVEKHGKISLRLVEDNFAVGIEAGFLKHVAAAVTHHDAYPLSGRTVGIASLTGKGAVGIVEAVEQSAVAERRCGNKKERSDSGESGSLSISSSSKKKVRAADGNLRP